MKNYICSLLLCLSLTSTCALGATYYTLYDCTDTDGSKHLNYTPKQIIDEKNSCSWYKDDNDEEYYKKCVSSLKTYKQKMRSLYDTGRCHKNGQIRITNNYCSIDFDLEQEHFGSYTEDEVGYQCMKSLRKEIQTKYPNVKPLIINRR